MVVRGLIQSSSMKEIIQSCGHGTPYAPSLLTQNEFVLNGDLRPGSERN
jgi:hypothetical protein